MTSTISDILLQQLSDFIAARLGLHFPKDRWRDLERGIKSAAREFGLENAKECAESLLSKHLTKKQIEVLASHLTIGETYFFRDRESLNVLNDQILPTLIRTRRGEANKSLRIWSAACSTGEEPYSIAILLDRLLQDIKDWKITILATDINPNSLQKASNGVYGEWSFRNTPQQIRETYFESKKVKRFEISQKIKDMVTFSYLNLAEDVYPALLNNTNGMDLILCRNVLMYFTQEQAKKVVLQLNMSLANGGLLLVSPVDVSHMLSSACFVPVRFQDTTIYKKDDKRKQIIELSEISSDWILETEEYEGALEPEITRVQKDVEHLSSVNNKQSVQYEEAPALYAQSLYAEEVTDRILLEQTFNQADSGNLALLTRTYANQGNLTEALNLCEKAVASDKSNPSLHYLLAIILQEQNQITEALASLRRSLYLDHNFVLAHFALGNLTRQQGKLKESKKHFQNALAILEGHNQEDILPESEGITAGRLIEIINTMIY